MNIKNRIIRLERENNPHGFCNCKPSPKVETYFQDLTEDSENTEMVLNGEGVSDICEQCNKPMRKEQIVFQLVDSTTKEYFPEEWGN